MTNHKKKGYHSKSEMKRIEASKPREFWGYKHSIYKKHTFYAEKFKAADIHVIEYSIKDSLFNAIKHGDQEHQDWLKEAIDNHFSGRPVPDTKPIIKCEHKKWVPFAISDDDHGATCTWYIECADPDCRAKLKPTAFERLQET